MSNKENTKNSNKEQDKTVRDKEQTNNLQASKYGSWAYLFMKSAYKPHN